MDLAAGVLGGDRLQLARVISYIEDDEPAGAEALAALYAHAGHAYRVGVTGPPGTGKSTLVNRLALHLRAQGWGEGDSLEGERPRVAIVAVDPSSPFTGGAILGDRIRMRDLSGDPGIFIRSMATRGQLGGLARTTADVVTALDAAGFGVVLIETVGAGQAEVDIAKTAQTTIVVDAPGLGDDVQANKAGILEIADIVVVNKTDLPGAENTLRALRLSLEMNAPRAAKDVGKDELPPEPVWSVPVLGTVATKGEGVPALAQALAQHRAFLQSSAALQEQERAQIRDRLERLLAERLLARFMSQGNELRIEEQLDRVLAREITPYQAAQALLQAEEHLSQKR
jgi:LAO/AO transport system kinase